MLNDVSEPVTDMNVNLLRPQFFEAAGIGTTVLTSGLIGTGAAMLNPGPKTPEAMFTAGAVSGIVSPRVVVLWSSNYQLEGTHSHKP